MLCGFTVFTLYYYQPLFDPTLINFSEKNNEPLFLPEPHLDLCMFLSFLFRLPGPSRVPAAGSGASRSPGSSNLNRRSQSFNSIDKSKPLQYASGNDRGKICCCIITDVSLLSFFISTTWWQHSHNLQGDPLCLHHFKPVG